MIKDLVYANRSCRRFREDRRLGRSDLLALIDLARLSASHRNAQELRFCPVWEEAQSEEVFRHVGFGAALGKEGQPREGQRPPAYIFIIGESAEQNYLWVDVGVACQSILLGAAEQGMLGCMLGNIQREKLRPILGLRDSDPPILLGLALGYPDEEFVIEKGTPEGSRKYWREGRENHVPKLALADIVLEKNS